ncbi:hypothetical protein CQ048_23785 [Pseudomonas trivialis]|nr:hypothetical protein CQ048_23785 [Pseudomonas trivialis]PRB19841.1 hypothetical protein CQ041_25695 [Pseudomonas sp. MYb60]
MEVVARLNVVDQRSGIVRMMGARRDIHFDFDLSVRIIADVDMRRSDARMAWNKGPSWDHATLLRFYLDRKLASVPSKGRWHRRGSVFIKGFASQLRRFLFQRFFLQDAWLFAAIGNHLWQHAVFQLGLW